ncbi:actin-like ATPase domain-containing protein, partial [Polyplosphaeria fusca]
MRQHEAETMKKGECFILCDAGGGTVDVVGYKVDRLDPNLDIRMMTVPIGSNCGSSYINRDFQDWLRSILGDEYYSQLDPRTDAQRISGHAMEGAKMRELMQSFEFHKKAFNSFSEETKLDLPSPLDNIDIEGYVESGELTVPPEVMRSLFDPYVDEAIELIQGQVGQIEAKRNRVKSVFLIGGFSESPFLREQLENSMRMRKLLLRRPDTSWSAVVRGAVLFGIEQTARLNELSAPTAAKSYGVTVSIPYSRRKHDSRDVYTDPLTGRVKAKEQIIWLVRKGDLLQSNDPSVIEETINWNFGSSSNRRIKLPIFQYPDDDIPDRFATAHEELEIVEVLTADLSVIPLYRFASR